jgi:DNA modification methylase
LTENGEWNREMLFAELGQLRDSNFDIGLTGFSNDELDRALAKAAEAFTGADPEHAPDRPEVPASRLGDLWILGEHRLLCGDSTSRADVALLLGGAVPYVMVTDPPYGVDYDPAWRARAKVNLNQGKLGKVQNDDRADWQEAWRLFPGAVAYVWHAGRRASEVQESLTAAGFETVSQIIWAKDRLVLSRGDYHWQHEPCWYCVREGNQHQWHGDRSQTTLWTIPGREDSGHGHGTQKPVDCMQRPMLNNSSPGDGVYDPFVGSGTSIIAATQCGRRCFAMEIDPGYVDVAVQRWQKFTGNAAVLLGDGRSFAEVAAERATKNSEKPRETAQKAAKPAANREKSQEIAV